MSSGPAAQELRRRDGLARERAQRCFDRPLLIEAGAGTGKTATLVARVVAWAMGPGWERALERAEDPRRSDRIAADLLSRVAAITFTDAAAAQMAERVGEALVDIEEGRLPLGLERSALPEEQAPRRERARALLAALDRLVVRTIHAWCHRLLARHPIEAGLHPFFQVDAEGRARAGVVRSALETALGEGYSDPGDPHLLALAAEGWGPPQLEEALVALVEAGVTPAALERDPLAPDAARLHFAGLAEALDAFRSEEGGRLSSVSQSASRTHAVLEALDATAQRLRQGAPADLDALQGFTDALREDWEGENLKRLATWAREEFNAGEGKQLGEAAVEVAARARALCPRLRAFCALHPLRLDHARKALLPLLRAVEVELRARGIATFASLLRDARDLLRSRPDVCARLRDDLDQLLVDEFQDTDPLQCEIVRAIALEGPPARRPGLFVVGDPKQSIYGWRSADLGAYAGFVREVERCGGELHSLCVNFRSAPVILEEVDRVMAPVMRPQEGLQPAFESLVAGGELADSLGFRGEGFAPIEYWASWRLDADAHGPAARPRAHELVRIEARALARDLSRLREGGVDLGQVALLLRGAGDLEEYLAALREAGVPYDVERDRSYYRRREVIEAAALVRCVLDPNDHLALLTLLRSAVVGVPDAALIPLWTRDLPQQLTRLQRVDAEALERIRALVGEVVDNLPERIPGIERVRGWEHNLMAAAEGLAALRESFVREPMDAFVERLRALFLIDATEAARYLGAFRAANLEQFFRELLEELAEGLDPQLVLRRLRRDVADQPEVEQARPRAAVEGAVRVMTIHKAKGLDFDQVYLLQLHKRPGGAGRSVPEVDQRDRQLEYHLFGSDTPGFESVRERRARVEAAEQVRTLYVAMTRAKQRLVLVGDWPRESELPTPERSQTHAALLASRADFPADLPKRMEEAAGRAGEPWWDGASARWVFPALLPEVAEAGARRRKPRAALPSAADVADQAERLRAQREQARAREQRSWGAAASEEAHAQLREQLAERRFGRADAEEDAAPRATPSAAGGSRDVATAVGRAVHQALEDFDLAAEPEAELTRQRERLPGLIEGLVEPARLGEAVAGAREVLDRFAGGALFERFRELRPAVVARELPVWIPPPGEGPRAPVGFVAGAIDLLYRDPESGEWVVADYKSDRVTSEAERDERAKAYASQGAAYVRAVRDSLGLEADPRFELWFLHEGTVVLPPLESAAP